MSILKEFRLGALANVMILAGCSIRKLFWGLNIRGNIKTMSDVNLDSLVSFCTIGFENRLKLTNCGYFV